MSKEAPSLTIARFSIFSAAVVFAIMVFLFLLLPFDSGDQIRGTPESNLESVKVVLESYATIANLLVASFGAIAFIVIVQAQRNLQASRKALGFLFAGILMMCGALMTCLFGREVILNMIGNNAVELTLPALITGRIMTYLLLTASAMSVGLYAVEIALAANEPDKTTKAAAGG